MPLWRLLNSHSNDCSWVKLEWLRCHENQDNAPFNALLTSESHNFWFDHWIFKIHVFSKRWSQDLSKGVKINLIKGSLKLAALEGLPPQNLCRGYKKPQAPFKPKEETNFFLSFALYLIFQHVFPIFQTQKTPKKHIKVSWFFSLHQKHKVLFLYPIFFSFVLHFEFGV